MAKWIVPIVLIGGLVAAGLFLFGEETEPNETTERETPTVEEPEVPVVEKRRDVDTPSAGLQNPDSQPVQAEPGEDGLLVGTVYDDRGNPLPGASVEVFAYRNRENPPIGVYRIRVDEETLGKATTDAQGRFAFSGLDVVSNYLTLRIAAEGFAEVLKDHVGPGVVVDAHMQRGASVTGVIRDVDTNQPVPDVEVEVLVRHDAATLHKYRRWRKRVKTDGEGRFAFPAMQAGFAQIVLDHPEYEREARGLDDDIEVHVGTENSWEFTMKRGLVLDGVVLDDKTGKPIKGAEIIMRDFLPLIPSQREATGVFGKFKMVGVRRGQQQVTIRAKGFTRHEEQLYLGDEETAEPVTFRLKPAGAASGTVLDTAGEPVAGARVFVAHRASIFRQVRDLAEATTDRNGRFSVGSLDDGGMYTFSAVAPGFTVGSSEEIEAISDDIVADIVIELTSGASIQGRVTDEVGIGIENVTVSVHKPPYGNVWFPPRTGLGQTEVLTLTTDRSGYYSVEGLYPGVYRLTPDHPDYIAVAEKQLEVRDGEEALSHDFTLKIGHTIQGKVVDHFGNPAADARIIATLGRSQGHQVIARTDEEGRYKLRRLLDRAYRVRAENDRGWAPAIEEVPADSTGIDFLLQENGRISGRVLTQSGSNPVSNFTVRISPLMDIDSDRERIDLTDRYVLKLVRTHEAYREEPVVSRDGHFTLDGVPPGDYIVEILSEEHRDVLRNGVQVLPGTTADLNVILMRGGSRFEGTVRDTLGQPVTAKDLRVTIAPVAGSVKKTTQGTDGGMTTQRTTPRWDGRNATPDDRGRFSIGGLPPGQVQVTYTSDTFCVPAPRVTSFGPEGVTQEDLTLTRAASIALQVFDPAGDPVVSPTANVLNSDGSIARCDGRRVVGRGDIHGKLNVRKMVPGSYQVEIQRWGFERKIIAVEVAEGEKFEARIEMEPLR